MKRHETILVTILYALMALVALNILQFCGLIAYWITH